VPAGFVWLPSINFPGWLTPSSASKGSLAAAGKPTPTLRIWRWASRCIAVAFFSVSWIMVSAAAGPLCRNECTVEWVAARICAISFLFSFIGPPVRAIACNLAAHAYGSLATVLPQQAKWPRMR